MVLTEDRLRTLLRVAESAHAGYEKERGEPDDDWPTWYAAFIVRRLNEETAEARYQLQLDADERRLLESAVHSYLDDFGHEEADVLRRLKDLHAKIRDA